MFLAHLFLITLLFAVAPSSLATPTKDLVRGGSSRIRGGGRRNLSGSSGGMGMSMGPDCMSMMGGMMGGMMGSGSMSAPSSSSSSSDSMETEEPVDYCIPRSLFASSRDGYLFEIDYTTSEVIDVKPYHLPSPSTEIVFDKESNTLWNALGGGAASIFNVDKQGSVIGYPMEHEFGAVQGMEYVDGTLYGTFFDVDIMFTETMGNATNATVDLSWKLVEIDTGDRDYPLVDIGHTGIENPISGLAYDTANEIMYGVTAGYAYANLATIDLLSGAVTSVIPITVDGYEIARPSSVV
ncbi:expressed unknown protein [Seminavis robusta]|uniref:Uncharacterized protein n=1 Tax=Seminavis robusta TaxID=568900 RepID=A0A9N8H2I7_9STRA|nr:expressed unknown protein [Seminavis robusta]|eukprot:Sro9_g007610.1 n/a (295) ;mRNA; f:200186-201281